MTFSPGPAFFIRGPKSASPSNTRGGSRVPEWGPLGSVRGALSNERPYRDLGNVDAKYPFERADRVAGIQANSGHRDPFAFELRRWGYAARARSQQASCAGSSPSRRIAQIAEIAAILRQRRLANCATQRRGLIIGDNKPR